jgi:hypothetical protein
VIEAADERRRRLTLAPLCRAVMHRRMGSGSHGELTEEAMKLTPLSSTRSPSQNPESSVKARCRQPGRQLSAPRAQSCAEKSEGCASSKLLKGNGVLKFLLRTLDAIRFRDWTNGRNMRRGCVC